MEGKIEEKISTNTHFYDNKVSKSLISRIEDDIQSFHGISKQEKLDRFLHVRGLLISNGITPTGLKYYDIMIEDFKVGNKNNCDPINNLDAIDLLYCVVNKPNTLPILCEQLEDMKTGFCPQGRTIRLVQIISVFI